MSNKKNTTPATTVTPEAPKAPVTLEAAKAAAKAAVQSAVASNSLVAFAASIGCPIHSVAFRAGEEPRPDVRKYELEAALGRQFGGAHLDTEGQGEGHYLCSVTEALNKPLVDTTKVDVKTPRGLRECRHYFDRAGSEAVANITAQPKAKRQGSVTSAVDLLLSRGIITAEQAEEMKPKAKDPVEAALALLRSKGFKV